MSSPTEEQRAELWRHDATVAAAHARGIAEGRALQAEEDTDPLCGLIVRYYGGRLTEKEQLNAIFFHPTVQRFLARTAEAERRKEGK